MACNCANGCPCQFNALPTHGDCQAAAGIQIGQGRFGVIALDGLRFVSIMCWPGPIHEGGKALMIIARRADEPQRADLLRILGGGETEIGATIWNVFAARFDEFLDPVYQTIDMAVDSEARMGHAKLDGLAEVVASHLKTTGPIPLAFEDRYAQLPTCISKTRAS